MSLFSKQHLESLEVGDELTTKGLFAALGNEEQVYWKLLEKKKNFALFSLQYMGVDLGNFVVRPGKIPKVSMP